MADQPSDIRWPPSSDVEFDGIFRSMLALKEQHFPEHTVKDLADPYIQILALVAALGQHAYGRANHALLQLTPKYATSRRALISLMGIVNRPLRPAQPARGKAYGRMKSAPVADTVVIPANQRISQPSVTDPLFSVDSDVSTGPSVAFSVWYHDAGAGTTTQVVAFPAAFATVEEGDWFAFGFDGLFFDQLDLAFNGSPLPAGTTIRWEYRNAEAGSVDSVSVLGGTLRFVLDGYLNGSTPDGVEVTITHKPTNVSETVSTSGGYAETSLLGQSTPSLSPFEYEVQADWRPIPAPTDGTSALTEDGELAFDAASVKSESNDWYEDSAYGYAVRAVVTGLTPPSAAMGLDQPGNSGDYYAEASITQGMLRSVTVGQTDGTTFQHLKLSSVPLDEPVADPKISITVGTEGDWAVVDDFSNSGPTSKHALFREDPDDGWSIVFGNDAIGDMPAAGLSVKIVVRTDSVNPGDLDPGTAIRALGGLGYVTEMVLHRGTEGYEAAEASDDASAAAFRYGVLPQLALRAESAVTSDEIVQALTGGAPYRATFETTDGRKPFSRALFSTTSAGDRQYRVIVVGDEADADGSVSSLDMDEAEAWLNGTEVGVEIVGGHGPNNTEALVGSYQPKRLLPTVTLTVTSREGVQAQADQIIRSFFKPHSRDENGAFRWSFGGKVPMPILFGLLWDGVPNRKYVNVSATDGVATYQNGDSVQLDEFELPALSDSYDPTVNIIIVVE